MPDLRTIIVDDEPLALELMRDLLERIGGTEIVAECRNGREAIKAIDEHQPDLLFLDIHMPGLNGFDVVKALQPDTIPLIVFATAYDQFALEAFEVHAVDYILKPLDLERLRQAIERARERFAADSLLQGDAKASLIDAIDSIETEGGSEPAADLDDQLIVRDSGVVHFVDQEHIDWIDAAGDYMCIHVAGETIVARTTMKELLEKLDQSVFVRIHRSTVVNVDHIDRLEPLAKGEAMLHLQQGKALKVSRSFGKAVRKLAR
jgi:two-component system LytT family response regulator